MRMACAISGMVAVHAKQAVFTALAGVPGIVRAEVELGRAEVWFTPGTTFDVAEADLIAAIEATGYRVTETWALKSDLPTFHDPD
ncbi:MAG: hypothetical protein P2975_06320 [Gemmatimonadota bacterium]|jgi:copper chaperone CopZ|nr:hypothetical protein [Gemmatimonadota bacterium]MDQ8152652.1 hypothetical protein [Gemmatimonadota bacterium]MDQ8169364.1 hypothetical protein [Gemmatimonadota bacterium]MDQ8174312.1 hypothetical protein [Gemmatimonadota bacterium]